MQLLGPDCVATRQRQKEELLKQAKKGGALGDGFRQMEDDNPGKQVAWSMMHFEPDG
jgi:hypothetical protein